MRQITLNIPDNKLKTFFEFLKKIPFVKIAEKKNEVVSDKQRKFTVMNVDRNNFKFNRDELNE